MTRAPSSASRGSTSATPSSNGRTAPGSSGKPSAAKCAVAEDRRHAEFRALGDLDLGAQPVHREPPPQIGEPGRLGVEPDRFALLDHDEIVQVFALRGQQRGIDGAAGREFFDIVRDEPLEETAAVRTRHGENAALGQQGETGDAHRLGPAALRRILRRYSVGRRRVARRRAGIGHRRDDAGGCWAMKPRWLPCPNRDSLAAVGGPVSFRGRGVALFFGLCRCCRSTGVGVRRMARPPARPALGVTARPAATLPPRFPIWPPAEIERIIRGMWDNLGRVAAEYPASAPYQRVPNDGRVEIARPRPYRARPRRRAGGMILFSGHLANWEISALAAGQYGDRCRPGLSHRQQSACRSDDPVLARRPGVVKAGRGSSRRRRSAAAPSRRCGAARI